MHHHAMQLVLNRSCGHSFKLQLHALRLLQLHVADVATIAPALQLQ